MGQPAGLGKEKQGSGAWAWKPEDGGGTRNPVWPGTEFTPKGVGSLRPAASRFTIFPLP